MTFQDARYPILLLLIFVGSVLIAFISFEFYNAVVVSFIVMAVTVALFFATRPWKRIPNNTSIVAIRYIALLTASYPGWSPFVSVLKSFNIPILSQILPNLNDHTISVSILVLSSILITAIAIFSTRPPLDTVRAESSSPFRDKTYNERFKNAAKVVSRKLNLLDEQQSWSENYFEPLDAEVEEINSNRRKPRRIKDLLTTIRRDRKTKVFLILGDAGSGKSVALRQLAKDLLDSSHRTGVMPLYINMREWKGSIKSCGSLPTAKDLHDFISDQIVKLGDRFTEEFFDEYFSSMVEHGRIFFILDSFDEIPALLDQDETSETIFAISSLIGNLLAGGADSRGVVASRPFRRPKRLSPSLKQLEVRPFTEAKIRRALLRTQKLASAHVDAFMIEGPRWIKFARNPFILGLLVEYMSTGEKKVPNSHVELYEEYVHRRLSRLKDAIDDCGLTIEAVKDHTSEIASFMYQSEGLGLEVSARDLAGAGFSFDIDNVVGLLSRARIVREGSYPERSVSFVHRRFNEYFLVRELQASKRIDLTSIENDRRERDALVLYAEIASPEEISVIVSHCWGHIRNQWEKTGPWGSHFKIRDSGNLSGIYCLRFLIDAFSKSNSPALGKFEIELAGLCGALIEKATDDPLSAKIAVEASGIFQPNTAGRIIQEALSCGEPWVAETAIRACRFIPSSDEFIQAPAIRFVHEAPYETVKAITKDFNGIFEAAEVLKNLRWRFFLRETHHKTRPVVAVFAVLLSPMISAIIWGARLLNHLSSSEVLNAKTGDSVVGRKSWHLSIDRFIQKYQFIGLFILFVFGASILGIQTAYTEALFINAELSISTDSSGINLDLFSMKTWSPLFYRAGLEKYQVLIAALSIMAATFSLNFKTMYPAFRDSIFFCIVLLGLVPYLIFGLFKGAPVSWLLRKLRDVVKIIKGYRLNFSKLFRAIVFTLFSLLVFSLGRAFLPYLEEFVQKNPWVEKLFLLLTLGFLISVAVGILYSYALRVFHVVSDHKYDAKVLKLNPVESLSTRSDIESCLEKFKSAKGREQFVLLMKERVRLEGWSPVGPWESESFPSYGDRSSSELARLEEKWLGLDQQ
ncbi:MAG: NACHT domain-containing protein [Pseudomonadota bacterium]